MVSGFLRFSVCKSQPSILTTAAFYTIYHLTLKNQIPSLQGLGKRNLIFTGRNSLYLYLNNLGLFKLNSFILHFLKKSNSLPSGLGEKEFNF